MQLAKPRNFRCPSDMKHLSSFFHNETPLAVCTIVSSRYSGQTVTSHKAAHRIITPLSSTSKWARCLCKQAAAAAAGSGEHRLTELILRRRVSQIAVLGRAVSVGSLWWVTAGGTDSIALTSRWLDVPPAAKRTLDIFPAVVETPGEGHVGSRSPAPVSAHSINAKLTTPTIHHHHVWLTFFDFDVSAACSRADDVDRPGRRAEIECDCELQTDRRRAAWNDGMNERQRRRIDGWVTSMRIRGNNVTGLRLYRSVSVSATCRAI